MLVGCGRVWLLVPPVTRLPHSLTSYFLHSVKRLVLSPSVKSLTPRAPPTCSVARSTLRLESCTCTASAGLGCFPPVLAAPPPPPLTPPLTCGRGFRCPMKAVAIYLYRYTSVCLLRQQHKTMLYGATMYGTLLDLAWVTNAVSRSG